MVSFAMILMGIDAVISEIPVHNEVKSFLMVSANLSRFNAIPSNVHFADFFHQTLVHHLGGWVR